MWRFLNNVDEPNAKKRKEGEGKSDKIQRVWNKKWLIDEDGEVREWLRYDESQNKMFCRCCTDKNAVFVTGSSNFKLESIKAHAKSAAHSWAEAKWKAMKSSSSSDRPTSPATKILQTLTQVECDRIQKLFRTAHALGKKAVPFSNFKWMCELDMAKGVDIGKTYHNADMAKEFVHFIAEVEREEIRKKYYSAKFVSLLSDGSTDTSVLEQEIIYMRFSHRGILNTYFIGIEPVPKADAAHINDAIDNVASQIDKDWKNKLISVGTDGASVMTGNISGVVKKLKGDREYVIGMHCMNHRLELAYRDTVRNNETHTEFDQFLRALYTFYHKSPLNRSQLKDTFNKLNMKPLFPTRVDGTRWLGHTLGALSNFLGGYRAIKEHLELCLSERTGEKLSKVRNIFSKITSNNILKYACISKSLRRTS